MTTAWRIVKTRRADGVVQINGTEIPTPFDGTGASRVGGRWNSCGVPVVYCSESQSLATLEILVHIEDPALMGSYSLFPVEFDPSLVLVAGEDIDLPEGWDGHPAGAASRSVGDDWAFSNRSVILKVPSVIIPSESNYLINPYHPDMDKLSIGGHQPFPFDDRLTGA